MRNKAMFVTFVAALFLCGVLHAVLLGTDRDTGKLVRAPMDSFSVHWHIVGGTGKGKTVSIIAMLQQLMSDPCHDACYFIVDRMGSFSFDLLRWFASPYCPEWVRKKLIYIQPSREDIVLPFNPLLYDTEAHGYYKVSRGTELILRGWQAGGVDIASMPRLARWTFNCFWAAAKLGLTIADCVHFLLPFSDLHAKLLACLPDQLRYEWNELLQARGRATEILDSTRNRLKPFWESQLRYMFGSTQSRLNVLDWMREGRIVLMNLAPLNRITDQLADAIGGLTINEVLSVARSLPLGIKYNTYLVLDEFQRFTGPDLETAIPEVRQLGIKLILSHQAFSQLKRGDYDLSSIIWQCQNRQIFGIQGEDADMLAHEIAALTYDADRIKQEIWHRKQLVSGHKVMELASRNTTQALSEQWNKSIGHGWSNRDNRSYDRDYQLRSVAKGQGHDERHSEGHGGANTQSSGYGSHETLVPIYDEFYELASRTYKQFDESKMEWGRDIRQLLTGQAVVRMVNDPTLYRLNVKRSAPGELSLDWSTVLKMLPQVADEVAKLIEDNFRQDCFLPPAAIERDTQARLQRIINPPIVITSQVNAANQSERGRLL